MFVLRWAMILVGLAIGGLFAFGIPISRERDLVHKRADYAAAGLAWYWLVEPEVPQVLVLENTGGAFEVAATATGEERFQVTAPFTVELRPADLA